MLTAMAGAARRRVSGQWLPRRTTAVARRDSSDPVPYQLVSQPTTTMPAGPRSRSSRRPNVRRMEWQRQLQLSRRSDERTQRVCDDETPEQNRNFNLGARGPIVKGKTSIRVGLDGRRDYQADTIIAIDENGNRLGDYVRRPSESDQRHRWSRARVEQEPDAASRISSRRKLHREQWRRRVQSARARIQYPRINNQVRAQVQGIVGKTRCTRCDCSFIAGEPCSRRSRRRQPIIVLDTFTKGGAGCRAMAPNRTFELAENLDFNIGRKQQMRVGYIARGRTLQELRRAKRRWYLHLLVARGLQREPAHHIYPAPWPGGHLVRTITRWASTGRTTSG